MPPTSPSYWRRQFEQVRRRRRMRRIRERLARQADPTYRPGMRLPEEDFDPPPRLPESVFAPPIVFQYPVSLMLLTPEARQERRLESDYEWNVRHDPDIPIGEVRPRTPPEGYDGARVGMVRCQRCKSWCHPSDTAQGRCFICREAEPAEVNSEADTSKDKENKSK